jgi:hypothetical protein
MGGFVAASFRQVLSLQIGIGLLSYRGDYDVALWSLQL